MNTGMLEFDNAIDRYIICFDGGSMRNRELHCGDVFEIMCGNEWRGVRIEYDTGWFLVGTGERLRCGMKVRA
jgi:hypothetical protein